MDRKCHAYVRDAEKGAQQIQKIVAYWKDHIETDVLPPLSGDPELDAEAIYKYQEGNIHAPQTTTMLGADTEQEFLQYLQIKADRTKLRKELSRAKETEEALLDQIKQNVPEGLSVCSLAGGVTFTVQMEDASREAVTTASLLTIPRDVIAKLQAIADITKAPSLGFTTPKVAMRKKPKGAKVK